MHLETHPQFCQTHTVHHAAPFMLKSISFNMIQWFPRRCPKWPSFTLLVLLLDNIGVHITSILFIPDCSALSTLVIIFPLWVSNGY